MPAPLRHVHQDEWVGASPNNIEGRTNVGSRSPSQEANPPTLGLRFWRRLGRFTLQRELESHREGFLVLPSLVDSNRQEAVYESVEPRLYGLIGTIGRY